MNLLSSHRRSLIITTAMMGATAICLSGFFGTMVFVNAAMCEDCRTDGGGGDGGSDDDIKHECRYDGISYSDGEIVKTPDGSQMKCENGHWMAVGIGYQGP